MEYSWSQCTLTKLIIQYNMNATINLASLFHLHSLNKTSTIILYYLKRYFFNQIKSLYKSEDKFCASSSAAVTSVTLWPARSYHTIICVDVDWRGGWEFELRSHALVTSSIVLSITRKKENNFLTLPFLCGFHWFGFPFSVPFGAVITDVLECPVPLLLF